MELDREPLPDESSAPLPCSALRIFQQKLGPKIQPPERAGNIIDNSRSAMSRCAEIPTLFQVPRVYGGYPAGEPLRSLRSDYFDRYLVVENAAKVAVEPLG
jgi:hypothetical protein